jgi:hypothetical protein
MDLRGKRETFRLDSLCQPTVPQILLTPSRYRASSYISNVGNLLRATGRKTRNRHPARSYGLKFSIIITFIAWATMVTIPLHDVGRFRDVLLFGDTLWKNRDEEDVSHAAIQ